jgi:hypothetical protein
MLWEIWGRHKWVFPLHGAALAASVGLVCWKEHGAPENSLGLVYLVSSCCFTASFIHLLACFGYIEVDARRVQLGFPGRLLLKPVSTTRLVLAPMLFGGASIVTVFVIWTELVLRHLVAIPASGLLWSSAVLLSFFWWMQALAWGLSWLKGRVSIDIIMAVIHLLVGCLPMMPVRGLSRWQWPILIALLVSGVPAAGVGLTLMRQGRWEGPSRISILWSRRRWARARGRRKKFRSAFGAQFWLEWRRQGWLLPCLAGGTALLICSIAFFAHEAMVAPGVVLIMPLLFSGVLAPALAKFDQLQSTAELPVYIAVRPMANGGFVAAKLLMALATSALAWVVTVAAIGLWLALMGTGTLLSKAASATPCGPWAFAIGCVPVLLLLVIWTWKNLVSGIAAGLTGRAWIGMASTGCRLALYMGLTALLAAAKLFVSFSETLLDWLPGLLILGLAAKIAVSVAAFVWGSRRNAITANWALWIIGGWAVCGLLAAGYAGLVCIAIKKPELWVCMALAGLLVFPLADLAIAPLALAWNRHR